MSNLRDLPAYKRGVAVGNALCDARPIEMDGTDEADQIAAFWLGLCAACPRVSLAFNVERLDAIISALPKEVRGVLSAALERVHSGG